MATIYKTDGTSVTLEPANGSTFTLEELQTVVNGYIELVHPVGLPNKLMVVNEDGHRLNLPTNIFATNAYIHGLVVGDVLVCDPKEIE